MYRQKRKRASAQAPGPKAARRRKHDIIDIMARHSREAAPLFSVARPPLLLKLTVSTPSRPSYVHFTLLSVTPYKFHSYDIQCNLVRNRRIKKVKPTTQRAWHVCFLLKEHFRFNTPVECLARFLTCQRYFWENTLWGLYVLREKRSRACS